MRHLVCLLGGEAHHAVFVDAEPRDEVVEALPGATGEAGGRPRNGKLSPRCGAAEG